MNKSVHNKYLQFLSERGQRQTHTLMGIDVLEFAVLSELYTDEEIIDTISNAEYGVFLFTDNQDFTKRTLNLLSQYIKTETETHSDLFNSRIKINSLTIDNQEFIVLIEVKPSSISNFF